MTDLRTVVETETDLVRTTPVTVVTTTVTPEGIEERDARITPMPRNAWFMAKSDYINLFRRQAENSTALPEDDNEIALSLSSACSCQGYVETTITETYTNLPNVSLPLISLISRDAILIQPSSSRFLVSFKRQLLCSVHALSVKSRPLLLSQLLR